MSKQPVPRRSRRRWMLFAVLGGTLSLYGFGFFYDGPRVVNHALLPELEVPVPDEHNIAVAFEQVMEEYRRHPVPLNMSRLTMGWLGKKNPVELFELLDHFGHEVALGGTIDYQPRLVAMLCEALAPASPPIDQLRRQILIALQRPQFQLSESELHEPALRCLSFLRLDTMLAVECGDDARYFENLSALLQFHQLHHYGPDSLSWKPNQFDQLLRTLELIPNWLRGGRASKELIARIRVLLATFPFDQDIVSRVARARYEDAVTDDRCVKMLAMLERHTAAPPSRLQLRPHRALRQLEAEYSKLVTVRDSDAAALGDFLQSCGDRTRRKSNAWWRALYLLGGNYTGEVMVSAHLYPLEGVVMDRLAIHEYTRGLQLALALHEYRLDNGEFPERVAALIPGYLPEIPRDPFDDTDLEISEMSWYQIGLRHVRPIYFWPWPDPSNPARLEPR